MEKVQAGCSNTASAWQMAAFGVTTDFTVAATVGTGGLAGPAVSMFMIAGSSYICHKNY